jgi:hypothetical protein
LVFGVLFMSTVRDFPKGNIARSRPGALKIEKIYSTTRGLFEKTI